MSVVLTECPEKMGIRLKKMRISRFSGVFQTRTVFQPIEKSTGK